MTKSKLLRTVLVGAFSTFAMALPAVSSATVDGDHKGQFGPATGDISDAKEGAYTVDPLHTYISATYNHLGYSYPVIGFTKFEGTLNIDPANLADMSLSINIDAASIDSRVEVFDGHLRGENFFDVANHPEITFVSTAAIPEGAGNGKVAGDLTIKGITKSVILDVVLHKTGKSPITGNQVIGVSAHTEIKRSDWDLGLYAPNVSDEVTITITAEFQKQ